MSGTSKFIFAFLLYTGLLIPFSSNPGASFGSYFKILLSMFMFILGNNIMTNSGDLKKTQVYFLAGALIICLQLVISNVFNLKNEGVSSYNDELITIGGGLVDNAKSLCFIALTFPILFLQRLSSKLTTILWVTIVFSIITFLLYFNRSAILGVIVGYVVILFYLRKRAKISKIILVTILAFIIVGNFLGPVLNNLFNERVLERDVTQESRAMELEVVWGNLTTMPLHEILFGKEIYNSDFINFGRDLYHGRQLHIDYDVLVIGSGLTGLLLYLGIIFSIYKTVIRYGRYLKEDVIYKILKPVVIAFIFASLIISYGGGIETIGFRSIFFLICGGILGILRNRENEFLAKNTPGTKNELQKFTFG